MFAMKYMSKAACLKREAVPCVIREIKILSVLEHPFLVNLWFSFQGEAFFSTKAFFTIVSTKRIANNVGRNSEKILFNFHLSCEKML